MVDFIYKFKFTDCQRQSAKSDLIRCPNHPSWGVDLHKVAPDIMFHDIDPDLLLSHEALGVRTPTRVSSEVEALERYLFLHYIVPVFL